jgi:DNA-directed RNA polymerase specialized sigma24 family protein
VSLIGRVVGAQAALSAVESSLHQAVIEARLEGATWQELADALGVSTKVAWARYTEDSRR